MARTRDRDACPGALHVHQAADGALARVRLPGGMITAAPTRGAGARRDAIRLAGDGTDVARKHPDPRRSPTPTRSPKRSPQPGCCLETHERVRNIVASPLSGRVGGVDRHPRTGRRAGQRDSGRARAGRAAGPVHVRYRRRPRRHLRARPPTSARTSSTSRRGAAAGGPRYRRPAGDTRRRRRHSWRSPSGSPLPAERLGG